MPSNAVALDRIQIPNELRSDILNHVLVVVGVGVVCSLVCPSSFYFLLLFPLLKVLLLNPSFWCCCYCTFYPFTLLINHICCWYILYLSVFYISIIYFSPFCCWILLFLPSFTPNPIGYSRYTIYFCCCICSYYYDSIFATGNAKFICVFCVHCYY